jgi:pilus assembly protein CpaE
MIPFPVILIGVSDRVLPGLRQELANAGVTVEAEYGSAERVIQTLSAKEADKRLLIVPFESIADAPIVGKLANAFRNWPILALVDGNQQAENLVRANRAGAAQVVPVPIQSADLRAALNSIGHTYRPAAEESYVLAFTGSAAGCGATTLATNAAYEIAVRHNRSTVLIELAAQMGVVASNLGIETSSTLADLLANKENLDADLVKRALVSVADNFRVLAASKDVGQRGSIPVVGALRVLEYVRSMADVIVLDVPCTYDDFQFEIIGNARQVVLVGEQSITSVRTLKLILDALATGAGGPNCQVVMNRYNPAVDGLSARELQRVLGQARIYTIPDDRLAVLEAANEGKLLRQMNPRSPVLAAIDGLVDSLLVGAANSRQPASKGLMHRLFHAFAK